MAEATLGLVGPLTVSGQTWDPVQPVGAAVPLPASVCIGRYSGGDGLCPARQLLNLTLTGGPVPVYITGSLQARIIDAYISWLQHHIDIPATERVASIPVLKAISASTTPAAAADVIMKIPWKWSVGIQFSSCAYGAPDQQLNVLCQGYLHSNLLRSTEGGAPPSRLGCSKWVSRLAKKFARD